MEEYISLVKRQLLRHKFSIRTMVAREPSLHPFHLLTIWWTQYKQRGHIDVRECRVAEDRDFVLDGFQGSGNSFATRAFKYAQSTPVRIAHHLHSPAQIVKAVRLEIPTLVTIREPKGAVVSLVSRWPYVSLEQGIRSYIRFYQKIIPYTRGFLVSPFDQTIKHLDRVFSAVNQEYDRNFDVFEHTEENVASVRNLATGISDAERNRQKFKRELKGRINKPQYGSLLDEAEEVYSYMESRGIGR